MRQVITFFFAFLSFLYGSISEKYELYRKFLETKDLKLANEILRKYPNAPFKNEIYVFLIEKYYKTDPRRAKILSKKLKVKEIPYYKVKGFIKIYKKLGFNLKPFLVNYPEFFLKDLEKYRLSKKEREKIAKRLYRLRKYKYVLKLTEDCYLKGKTYYRLGKYGVAEKILKRCPKEEAQEFLIYVYLKQSEYKKAEEMVRKKGNPRLYFILGRELLERGLVNRAISFLRKSMDTEASFYLGLAYYLKKDYEKAKHYFLSYYSADDFGKAKKAFWLFKTELLLGNTEEALNYLKETSSYDNFYGAVSRKILGMSVYTPVQLSSVEPPRLFSELYRIRELGFLHYMRYEALKNKDLITSGDILLLTRLDPYTSIRLAVKKYGVNSEIYKVVSHPTPYRDLVFEVSQKYGVSASLIYAVMRQESLFDPYAVSPSGAKGLMQLIDSTAKWKAKRLGVRMRNIFDPKTNITLGTAYLSFLMDYWDGDLIRVIASYNAGQKVVSKWKRYEDDFLFIELIPYTETKNYVKRVLYNYYIYSEKLEEGF